MTLVHQTHKIILMLPWNLIIRALLINGELQFLTKFRFLFGNFNNFWLNGLILVILGVLRRYFVFSFSFELFFDDLDQIG